VPCFERLSDRWHVSHGVTVMQVFFMSFHPQRIHRDEIRACVQHGGNCGSFFPLQDGARDMSGKGRRRMWKEGKLWVLDIHRTTKPECEFMVTIMYSLFSQHYLSEQ